MTLPPATATVRCIHCGTGAQAPFTATFRLPKCSRCGWPTALVKVLRDHQGAATAVHSVDGQTTREERKP